MSEKGKIKLIATDLDGTLLNEKNVVSAATAAAVKQAEEAGVLVVPATGRQLSGVPHDVLALPGITYVLTSNGAKVYNILTNETLVSNCISVDIAVNIYKQIEQFDCFIGAYIDGCGYMPKGSFEHIKDNLTNVWYEYFVNTRTEVDDLAAFIAQHACGVEKFTLHFNNVEERARANRHFTAIGDIITTTSSDVDVNLELNAKTANKGWAVMELAGKLGIEKAQVMAMGDNHNDIDMLKAVGYSVAMGNAEAEVKALAAHITLSNRDEGAAAAILSVL